MYDNITGPLDDVQPLRRWALLEWFEANTNTRPAMLDTESMRELAVTIQSRFKHDQKQRIPKLTKQATTKYQLG